MTDMKWQIDVLDHTGHTTLRWDPYDKRDVEAARQTFEALIAKGYQFFLPSKLVGAFGMSGKGAKVTKFDPHVEKLIFEASTKPIFEASTKPQAAVRERGLLVPPIAGG